MTSLNDLETERLLDKEMKMRFDEEVQRYLDNVGGVVTTDGIPTNPQIEKFRRKFGNLWQERIGLQPAYSGGEEHEI